MGLLKRDSSKYQEESVFGRHGKAQVSYSLETEKQEKESHHLIDCQPLLISDAAETLNAPNATPSKKKKKRNSMKTGEILKSPQRRSLNMTSPLGVGSGKFSLTPLSGSKKKVSFRKLFCASPIGNKTKKSNQYRLDYGEAIPKLALSGETDYQSDSEGKVGNENLSDVTSNHYLQEETSRKFNLDDPLNASNFTLFDKIDSAQSINKLDTAASEVNTSIFGAIERKSSNKYESSDSLDELMATKSSNDGEDENQEHRQQDLIKFLSETTTIKSSIEDNCKEDTVNVLHELISLENNTAKFDDRKTDAVNVLNELITFENSRFASVEEGRGSAKKTDPQYRACIRDIVAKTIQGRCNNAADVDNCPREQTSDADGEEYSSYQGISNITSYDEESTVVTVKCSNRSNIVEKNPSTPKVCTGHEMNLRLKERSSSAATNSFKIRKKKYQQAIKIYEDALNLKVTDFKNVQAYHSTMIVTATKLANLYIATGQNDVANKYVDASKKHRLYLNNASVDSSSSGSFSSSFSSSSSSSFQVSSDP
jgi:hypothetical protein